MNNNLDHNAEKGKSLKTHYLNDFGDTESLH